MMPPCHFKRHGVDTQACFGYWCRVGVFSEVLKCYEKSKEDDQKDINIRVDDDEPFKNACKMGNLDLVRWILNQTNDEIDIHLNNDMAFHKSYNYSIETGRFGLTHWLIDHCDVIPSSDHPMYNYSIYSQKRKYQSYKVLLKLIVKSQRKIKHWLYCPEGKFANECIVRLNEFKNI